MPETWIERDFKRTDANDVDHAKRMLQDLWPEAVFLEPVEVGGQTITHVHSKPKTGDAILHSPDAVIVAETRRD